MKLFINRSVEFPGRRAITVYYLWGESVPAWGGNLEKGILFETENVCGGLPGPIEILCIF